MRKKKSLVVRMSVKLRSESYREMVQDLKRSWEVSAAGGVYSPPFTQMFVDRGGDPEGYIHLWMEEVDA